MADKLMIEIFKRKNADEFTQSLADPAGKMQEGSAAAATAAMAAALCERGSRLISDRQGENERLSYLVRNAEILRGYMVHLIDEDVKSRGPLNRARKEGGEREIEAARQTAVCINAEIVNMMGTCLTFVEELAALGAAEARQYLLPAAELALSATRVAREAILFQAAQSCDDTYRYVTERENEISLQEQEKTYERIRRAL